MPPADSSIHPQTRIGPVALTVSRLENQVRFYQEALGFQVRRQEGSHVILGSPARDLLELVENPTADRYPRTTGLYHFALLYPDRRELARAVARLYSLQIPNSPTDHIMTKTAYLNDLEGNGIELYCESPEDGHWTLKNGQYLTFRADGSPSSGREPLDVEALFANLQKGDRLNGPPHPEVRVGHVHLHVRNLEEALDFYAGVLGFDRMGADRSIGMGFVSAGGYHHHIGLNTWQGAGAPAPPEDSLGLRHFTVVLPGQKALDKVLERLRGARVPILESEDGVLVRDPSRNGVLLSSTT